MSRGAIPVLVTMVLLVLLGVAVVLGPRILQQRTQTKSQAGETVPTIKIIPETIEGTVGQQVTFNIFIDTAGKAVVGADVDLTYDPNALTIAESGITTGAIFTNYQGGLGGGAKLDASAGKISLSGLTDPQTSPRPSFSGEAGLFATITATLKTAGTVSIDFTPGSTDDSNLTEDGTNADVLAQVKNATLQTAVVAEGGGFGGGMTKKVFLLNFNPIAENRGTVRNLKYPEGERLRVSALFDWADPNTLTTQFIGSVREASHGVVNYQIAQQEDVDAYPVKADGFQYTNEAYTQCVGSRGSQCHNPDGVNYLSLINQYDICGKVNRGEIDELWIWGGPWFGYYESALAGPEGFWYNSPPLTGTSCTKRLPIMGFNYERGEAEMFEDLAHRTESVMKYVYGSWEQNEDHAWNRFSLLDVDKPGRGGCGNAHLGVNANSNTGYDRENSRTVRSSCEDFTDYPNLDGTLTDINCTAWGCTAVGYMKWWFGHLPRAEGETDGKLNNWWKYIVDIDNTPLRVVGNYGGGVTTPTWTNLSATMSKPGDTVFSWTYTGPPGEFAVDVSTVADMSSDVWGSAASSVRNTATWYSPPWDKYTCNRTLYWRVRSDAGQSSISSATVSCPTDLPLPPPPVETAGPATTGPVSPTPRPTPIPGDYNNDGVVNTLDLSRMYGNWGRGGDAAVDLNKDNRINSVDYGILLQNFGR